MSEAQNPPPAATGDSEPPIDPQPIPLTQRRVGVVLVEYRSAGLVADRAAEALAQGLAVAVADNSGTYAGPGIIVDMGENVGFGAACNQAASALPSEVDVLVLQNPDAMISADDLEVLVDAIRAGWAAVAPGVAADRYRPYGYAVPGPAREFALVVRDVVHLRRRSKTRTRRRRAYERTNPRVDVPVERERRFGTAALLAVDRKWYEHVGGFDERYFLYVEDLDLWERLRRAGGRVGFCPSVVAHHASGTGSEAPDGRRTLLRWLGRELFAESVGRQWRCMRRLHRYAARLLPPLDDVVAAVAAAQFRSDSSPEVAMCRVRKACASR